SPDLKITTIEDDPILMKIQQSTFYALQTHAPDEQPAKKAKPETDSASPSIQQEKRNTSILIELEVPIATPTGPTTEESTNPISQPQNQAPLLPQSIDPTISKIRINEDDDMANARSDTTMKSIQTADHKTYSQAVTRQRTDRSPRQLDKHTEL
ncbi:13973_t:CDS:2, partial [Gigaspora margarita]